MFLDGLKFLLLLFVLLVFSGSVLAEKKHANPESYDSSRTYPGVYAAESLFMRRSVQKAYVGHRPQHLDQVTCRAAHQSLAVKGRWEGNLKASGACTDPAEPADWVTGNYLNYITGR